MADPHHDHTHEPQGPTAREREFQRGATEQNPQKGENEYEAWFSNQKLTYDTHLEILATQARRSQGHYDSLVTKEREHTAELHRISLQSLQNAVETANLAGKDALRHAAIATDQQWNLEPQEAVAESTILREVLNQPAMAALQAAIVQAVVQGFKEGSKPSA